MRAFVTVFMLMVCCGTGPTENVQAKADPILKNIR